MPDGWPVPINGTELGHAVGETVGPSKPLRHNPMSFATCVALFVLPATSHVCEAFVKISRHCTEQPVETPSEAMLIKSLQYLDVSLDTVLNETSRQRAPGVGVAR